MKRLFRIGIVSLAAAVVLFAALHYMRAQGQTSPNAVKAPHALSVPLTTGPSVPHILVATYMTQGLAVGTEETGGVNLPVDNLTTFKCLLPCTLEIEQTVQVGAVSYAANWWAPVVNVDGSPLAYSPFVGQVPTDDSYVLATVNQSISLKPGTHTVQSFVYSYYGLYLEDYHINYRVYTP